MTKFIAHRGFAFEKVENTISAFEYAGKTKAFGIETDVHKTKDGKFVIFHDDSTLRMCKKEYIIEDTDYATLQSLVINNSKSKEILTIPTLQDYILICKKYDKIAFLEFKNRMLESDICEIVKIIKDLGWYNKTTFISFNLQNLIDLRKNFNDAKAQLIILSYETNIIQFLALNKIGLDIEFTCLSRDRIQYCHNLGIEVNCWTLNDEDLAQVLIDEGIDYITTNNLGQ